MRRSFERAAATYDSNNVLQCEVGLRLMKHLDPIRIEPTRIVDVGCGTGMFLEPLARRYPKAEIVGVDIAHPMLRRAAARTPWFMRLLRAETPAPDLRRRRAPAARHGIGTLRVLQPRAAVDAARERCSPRPRACFPVGGLFMFSTFGPDTLKELRAAFAAVDGYQHVNTFIDMHDLGDGLVHAGFADPVMEMEVITLEYATVEKVARDLKAIGAHNSMPGRPRGLAGRARWRDGDRGLRESAPQRRAPGDLRGGVRSRLEGGATAHRRRTPGDRLPRTGRCDEARHIRDRYRHGRRQDARVLRAHSRADGTRTCVRCR